MIEPMSPQMFEISHEPGRSFWEAVFLAAIQDGNRPHEAAKSADESLAELHSRFPPKPACQPGMFVSGLVPMPSAPRSLFTVEDLMRAQRELEAARKSLDAIRELADLMPDPELGKAYYAVTSEAAEQRVTAAEQWVGNIQKHIEDGAEPAPQVDAEFLDDPPK